MTESFDYCILGGGVVGSSAAYLLARDANSVVLLEQFELGHANGSSHGESRIIRYSYDHPYYVRMSKRAYPLWAELIKETAEPLMLTTTGIDLDEENGKRISACIESLRQEKIEHEVLDAAEIGRRFPQFHLPAHTQGLFQKDTGLLNPALCVKTLQTLARKNGAILYSHSRVLSIEYHGKHVIISTADRKIKTKKLIIAAGGWAGPLLTGFGLKLDLQVSEEQYAFFKPLKPEAFQAGRFPVFIHYNGAGSGGIGWYGLPVYGRDGIKSSVHRTGKIVSAARRDFQIDENVMSLLKELMHTVLPDAAGEIIHTQTCLYTNSPDTHFVIDYLPQHENTVFFTGCSGHAFKFGIVIAEMLIAMLAKEPTLVPMDLFSLSRFKRNLQKQVPV